MLRIREEGYQEREQKCGIPTRWYVIWISKRWDADWVSSSWYGKNGGYVQWAKKYNVKQFAESILFLQQHAIHDKKTLDALVDGSSAKYHELMKTIKDAEEKMAANKVIKTHIIIMPRPGKHTLLTENQGIVRNFSRHIGMKSLFIRQPRKHFQNCRMERSQR